MDNVKTEAATNYNSNFLKVIFGMLLIILALPGQDASSQDNGHVSSSDAREPSQSVIQPSRFSGAPQGFWGEFMVYVS